MKTASTYIQPAYLAQLASVSGSACLTLLSTPLISAEDRGQLAIFLLYPTLGSYLASLGLPSRMLTLGAQGRPADARALFFRSAPISLIVSGLAFLVGSAIDFGGTRLFLVAVGALAMFVGSLFNMASWYDYGNDRYVRSTSLRGIIPGLAFLTIVAGVLTDTPAVLNIAISTYALTLTASTAWLLGAILIAGHSTSTGTFLADLTAGLSYFTMQSATLLWLRTPVLVGAFTLGPASVALVSLALSVAEIQGQLPQMRAAITFTQASQSADPHLKPNQVKHIGYLLLPGLATAFVVATLAPHFLNESYANLLTAVAVTIPGAAAFSLLSSALNILAAQGNSLFASKVMFLLLAAAILMFALLGPVSITLALGSWSAVAVVLGLVLVTHAMRPPVRSGGQ